jgi:hypothetical protein
MSKLCGVDALPAFLTARLFWRTGVRLSMCCMVSNPEEDWNGSFSPMTYELKPDHKRIKPVPLTPTASSESKHNLLSAASPERIISSHEDF